MNKILKMKERLFGIILVLVMMVSLLAGLAPVEARAAEVNDTIENLEVSLKKTAENTFQVIGADSGDWVYTALQEGSIPEVSLSELKKSFKQFVSEDDMGGFNKDVFVLQDLVSDTITVSSGTTVIIIGKVNEEDEYFCECSEMAWFDLPTNVGDSVTSSLGTNLPDGGEEIYVEKVQVQVDWSRVPALEVGMSELPGFENDPATAKGEGVSGQVGFGWAIHVDDSFKTSDKSYNDEIDGYITYYGGWAPLDLVFENDPTYRINAEDTYALWVYVGREEGYTFGEYDGGAYTGVVKSNVVFVGGFPDDFGMVAFFKLGTLAEIEQERNEAADGVEGDVEKDTAVAPDAPIQDVTLNNTTEELMEAGNIFDDEDLEDIANGADAKVWLEIKKTEENNLPAADKEKMEAAAGEIMGDEVNITYFDASLFKQVGNSPVEPISEPGVDIEISIVIPTELINTDKTIDREYMILRLHEGDNKPEVISGTFDAETGEFSFKTNKFSTYAIVYKDTPANAIDVPGTGDNNSSLVYALLLMGGIGFVMYAKRKEA